MNQPTTPDVDVIVVGAGISGLQTAALLQKEGLSCVILEARGRIGGKVLTTDRVEGKGGPSIRQEYGAAWINDSTQGHVAQLAKELGLTLLVQNSTGDALAQDLDGTVLRFVYGTSPEYPSAADTAQCIALRELIEAESTTVVHTPAQREELDSISYEAWVYRNTNGNTRALATAKASCHAMIGCDPSEVSALFFLDYCRTCGGMAQLRGDKKHMGQYLRIFEGTSALLEGLEQRLHPGTLKLNSPVSSVHTSPEGKLVRVTVSPPASSPKEQRPAPVEYTAGRVVLSIPTPVYKTIEFNPPLSHAKSTYIRSTRYSFYVKYLVTFKRPFWREQGLCGLAQSFVGPVSVFRDTSVPDGHGVTPNWTFTCFIGGSAGRKWSTLSPADRTTAVLDQIGDIFNGGRREEVRDLFVQHVESPWMTEEYNGWGCPIPSLPAGGILSRCWNAFVAPEGALHFVGNEFSTVWRGYLDGGLRTAERTVAEIVAERKQGKERAQL